MSSHPDSTRAVWRRRFYRRFFQWFAVVHRWVLIRTKGRPTKSLRSGYTFLVLETIGAKSGALRQVPLLYLRRDGGYIVLASNFGQERPPAWFVNLRARPDAHVLTGGRRLPIRARVLDDTERDALIPTMRAYNRQWNSYFDTVERTIPIVLLERQT